MEPFGLLSFLQSLLAQQPIDGKETPPTDADGVNGEKAEPIEQSTETTKQTSARQNAAASFLTAHEKRSSRIKK